MHAAFGAGFGTRDRDESFQQNGSTKLLLLHHLTNTSAKPWLDQWGRSRPCAIKQMNTRDQSAVTACRLKAFRASTESLQHQHLHVTRLERILISLTEESYQDTDPCGLLLSPATGIQTLAACCYLHESSPHPKHQARTLIMTLGASGPLSQASKMCDFCSRTCIA